MRVITISAHDTHPLRRRVLRTGTASTSVVFDGDERADTVHLGVDRDGELVAISTWLVRGHPDLAQHSAHQLRGMATSPAVRATGAGALLLTEGVRRCADAGSQLVWARSRLTALGFYEHHGFTRRGPTYHDLTTGLEHCDIVRFIA